MSTSQPERITQQQIAEIVGVSNVTVSNVLHRGRNSRISLEKQREIQRVAREMGYRPRGLNTRTIGFVIASGELHLDVTENEIVYAHETLKARGYRMLFVMIDDANPESLREVLNQKTVDGVLFTCWCGGKIQHLLPDDVPYVLLSEERGSPDIDQVSTDTETMALETTRRLLAMGHKRLCLVTGSPGIGYHERLKRGVAAGLRESGLPPAAASIIEVAHNDEIGTQLIELLNSPTPATAIMAASAGKAMVALNRLQWAGVSVPDQVSLVSFGDSYRLTPLKPAISALTVLDRDMMEQGVERLMQRIKNPLLEPRQIFLSAHYIERDSVASLHALQASQQNQESPEI